MAAPRILVLMTTYNGERYLRGQLDSVLAQEGVEVQMRIRDDASSDGTWAILQEYAQMYPNIEIARNEPNLGCIRNFMGLIYGVGHDEWSQIGKPGWDMPPQADGIGADYVAICDQDDVWLPNKLVSAVAALESVGAPKTQPALYYADVTNVDEGDNVIGNEYAPYKVCAAAYGSLLLVQNWCLGCTTLMNAALVSKLQERPAYDFERMYDAWIHAVALYCGGRVVCDLDHSYIRRRISATNTVGVMNEKRSAGYIVRKGLILAFEKDRAVALKHTMLARRLLEEYGADMDDDTRQLVSDVANRETDAAARKRL